MTPVFLRAKTAHAAQMASIIAEVWPDQVPEEAYLARVLQSPETCCIAALDAAHRAVGFCAAFMTSDSGGEPRWEVDLLAVLPESRGTGLAHKLVDRALEFGIEAGAHSARAVVRIGNTPAERTFRRAGFTSQGGERRLVISSRGEVTPQSDLPEGVIPVSTLTYSGLWVEGEKTPEIFRAAQGYARQHGLQTVGALCEQHTAQILLDACPGFAEVGRFSVLTRRFG
jgi:ribosomal protein S18 acetylase RimI-like enzyme